MLIQTLNSKTKNLNKYLRWLLKIFDAWFTKNLLLWYFTVFMIFFPFALNFEQLSLVLYNHVRWLRTSVGRVNSNIIHIIESHRWSVPYRRSLEFQQTGSVYHTNVNNWISTVNSRDPISCDLLELSIYSTTWTAILLT